MTTRQIAEAAGVSIQTVRRAAEQVLGHVFESGKKSEFNEKESITIMVELRKKGFIQPVQNGQVPVQNGQVDRIDRLESMVEKLCLAVATIPQTIAAMQTPKQIEFVQDYYSIKGYASKLGVKITFSGALALGKSAGILSREKNIEIRKVDDESYGFVNSYHVSILEEVFSM